LRISNQNVDYYVPAGPNGIVTTGTFLPVLEYAVTFIMSCIDKMQRERIASMTPKLKAVKAYSRQAQRYFQETVYSDQCRTWMRGCKTDPDRIIAIYPGSYLHFRKVLGNPRWEDFDHEMMDEEETFAFFGNGMTEQDMDMKGNFAPYMDIESEYPELHEFFEKDKSAKAIAKQGRELNEQTSGSASVKLEQNGMITVHNEYVEHVPVTA
jgi:hypothetical protein